MPEPPPTPLDEYSGDPSFDGVTPILRQTHHFDEHGTLGNTLNLAFAAHVCGIGDEFARSHGMYDNYDGPTLGEVALEAMTYGFNPLQMQKYGQPLARTLAHLGDTDLEGAADNEEIQATGCNMRHGRQSTHDDAVRDKLIRHIEAGHIAIVSGTADDVHTLATRNPNFRCASAVPASVDVAALGGIECPVYAISKKDGSGRVRIITDSSPRDPATGEIMTGAHNDVVRRAGVPHFRLPGVHTFTANVGHGWHCIVADMASAFLSACPLSGSALRFSCVRVPGTSLIGVWCKASFGSAASPLAMATIGRIIELAVNGIVEKYQTHTPIPAQMDLRPDGSDWFAANPDEPTYSQLFVDDQLGAAPSHAGANALLGVVLATWTGIGIGYGKDKLQTATTSPTYLGFAFDTVAETIALPPAKAKTILEQLTKVVNADKVTMAQLRSIAGRLNHAAIASPAGAAFTSGIREQLSGLQAAHARPRATKRLWAVARADMLAWIDAVSSGHFASPFPILAEARPIDDSHIAYTSDASDHGIAFVDGDTREAWALWYHTKDIPFVDHLLVANSCAVLAGCRLATLLGSPDGAARIRNWLKGSARPDEMAAIAEHWLHAEATNKHDDCTTSMHIVGAALQNAMFINVSESIAVVMGVLMHPTLSAVPGNVPVGVDNVSAVCALGGRSTRSRGGAAAARACADLLFRSQAVRTGVVRVRPAWLASAANPRADALSRRAQHPDVDTVTLVHPALAMLVLAAGASHREATRRLHGCAEAVQIGTWRHQRAGRTPNAVHKDTSPSDALTSTDHPGP